jgi:trehalose 6-phosphate phosphatase
MREVTQEALDQLISAYSHGSTLILLFDYDGTLTPIVEHPMLAILAPGTRQVLARLKDRANAQIGILSGRTIADLQTMLALPGLYLAGTSGLELDLCGTRIEHPQARKTAAVMEQVAARLESELAAYPGAWLEEKRLALTVHYRQLAGHLLGALQTSVEQVTRTFASDVRIIQGPRAWEIMPCRGWTKGSAVRLILADVGATNAALLYAGDGSNDAEAMEVVTALGGITLGIGPHPPTAARYRLPTPAALFEFLRSLDGFLEGMKCAPTRPPQDHLALSGSWKPTLPTSPT